MGGQACILYGAAEFSRDVDIAVDVRNLERLRAALDELQARQVFFPPLSAEALLRGHACHFRCRAPGLLSVRLDVMAVFRNTAPFEDLWRRVTLRLPGAGRVNVMAIEDLVQAKKTQRDKDWPMIRRLIEADVARAKRRPHSKILFWLKECRTPELLIELARRHPRIADRIAAKRPAVRHALRADRAAIERALRAEEDRERELDKRYWTPLRAELERWRMQRPRG